MTIERLESIIRRCAPIWRLHRPALFLVPTLPLEAGDKLPITASYDADGSLVIEVDTADVYLVGRSSS